MPMESFETGLIGFLLIQGLLLSILFFRKKPRLCNIMMGLLIFRFSMLMLNLLSEDSTSFPEIPIPLFLTGPLLLLYIRKSRNGGKLKPSDWLLFCPLLLNIIPLPESETVSELMIPLLDVVWTVILGTAALVAALRLENSENGRWYVLMPALVLSSSLVSALDFIFLAADRPAISDFFSFFMTILEGSLIFIPAWYLLYSGRNRAMLADRVIKQREAAVKYEKNLLDESLLEIYHKQLQAGMNEKGWYKQAGLSLNELSKLLSIPVVHLSQVINRKEGVNFFQYLNRLRIDEVCRLLGAESENTILDIMYEAGFSSKSTFNTAFRAQTGKTPKEFRDSL